LTRKKLGISPQIVRRINENGIDPFLMGSAQMGAFIAADYQRMGKLIKDVGIHGE
jgi:tripartite-type tricarboxylate transporter receptor subunit TctC